MSDIVIRGMEMPKSCFECGLRNGIVCFAGKNVLKVDFDSLGGALRHWDCPLVELPPHGRLIDADRLIKRYKGECWEELLAFISNEPTVLEASEE